MRRSRFSSDFILRSVDPRKFLQVVNVFRNKTLVPCAFSWKTIIKKNEKEKEMKRMAQSVKAAKTCFVWKDYSRLQSPRLWARRADALFKREKEKIEIASISSQDTLSQPCVLLFFFFEQLAWFFLVLKNHWVVQATLYNRQIQTNWIPSKQLTIKRFLVSKETVVLRRMIRSDEGLTLETSAF